MGLLPEIAFTSGTLLWPFMMSAYAYQVVWGPVDRELTVPPFYSDLMRSRAIKYALCGILTPLILWAWVLVKHASLWPPLAVSVAGALFAIMTLRGYYRSVAGKTYGVLTAMFLVLVIAGLDISLIVMFWRGLAA